MECNHNLNDKNHTLKYDKKKLDMCYPKTWRCICTVCKNDFSFIKVDGEYIEN